MAIMKIKMYDLREGLNADKLLPMNTLSGCFLSAMLCSSVDDSALHLATQGPDHMLLSFSSLPGQSPKPYSLSSALALLTSDLQTESKMTFQKCQLHYIPSYLRDIPETSLPIYYKMQRTSSVFSPPCALATWLFFLFAKNTIYWIPTSISVFALSLSPAVSTIDRQPRSWHSSGLHANVSSERTS